MLTYMSENESAKSLYDEIGGQAAIKTAVTIFYNRVTADETLAAWFDGVDLSRLRTHQRAFLATALDGPPVFAGRNLREAHAGMAITDDAFTSIVTHLAVTLEDLEVADHIVAAVEAKLEALRSEVVDR
jgi:hemoglobin